MKDNNIRIPDYRFSIIRGKLLGESLMYESFDMYIDKRKPIDGNDENGAFESVEGTIEDKVKIGDFKGELSEKIFNFIVTYNGNAKYHGLSKGKTVCEGIKKKDAYIGCFEQVTDDDEKVSFSLNNRFGVRKYDMNKAALINERLRTKKYPTFPKQN
jgi:hypothetical protein